MTTFKVAVVTISDRCSKGQQTDVSGAKLSELVQNSNKFQCQSVEYRLIPDERDLIKESLKELVDSHKCDLIVTTGGTGFAERDVTPEATKDVIDREAPGITHALMKRSLEATPMAALSRLVCGIRKSTLIVNFPGSSKAVQECFEVLEPLIPHSLALLKNNLPEVNKTHQSHTHKCDCGTSLSVAERPRQSQFPMISVEEALNLVLKESNFSLGFHSEEIYTSFGYVLAENIDATEPQPPFRASVKDGYAVCSKDGVGVRKLIGVSTAGKLAQLSPTDHAGPICIRISTGAPVPDEFDSVVQVEDTEVLKTAQSGEEEEIKVLTAPKPDQDIRPVGCDVQIGDRILSIGTHIGPAEIGLLASVGRVTVEVCNRPTVSVLSTGNELVEYNESNVPFGSIRDSNRPMICSILSQLGYFVYDAEIAKDERSELITKIDFALTKSDVLITSGGVSMGEKDLVKDVLSKEFGFQIHFGRVNMKPGKPTVFFTGLHKGKRKISFGLPGNPVSAYVTAHLFVLPALRRLSGWKNADWKRIKVALADAVELDSRPEYLRAELSWGLSGPTAVSTGMNQMSSRLLSTRQADLLVKLPGRTEQKSKIEAGEIVEALLIRIA